MADDQQPALQLRLCGTRGSIPTPIATNLGHGGNTSCIQILIPGHPETTFIFDAGTGIHTLGRELSTNPATPHNLHIFLTHFHWDHIQGLPGFAPLFTFAAFSRIACSFCALRPSPPTLIAPGLGMKSLI